MSAACVVEAEFVDYKTVRTRGALQLILEVPIERQAEIFLKLGYPLPGEHKWVAVALLGPKAQLKDMLERSADRDERTAKAAETRSRAGKERYANSAAMEQARTRAALLAKDPQFQMWSGYRSEDSAAAFIRRACGVDSRRDIATSLEAFDKFLGLERQYAEVTGRLAENRR